MDLRNCSSWGFDAVIDATFGYSHTAPPNMNRLFLVAALVVGLPLAAAPKVVILPFEGKNANAGRSQFYKELCAEVTCILDSKVSKKGKVDWAKVKKEKVTHIISGEKSGKKTELIVRNAAKKQLLKQAYLTGPNGRFFPGPLKDAVSDVKRAVGGGAAEEEEEKEEEEAPPKKEEVVAEKEQPTEKEEAEEKEEEEAPPKKEEVVAKKEEKPDLSEDVREDAREEKTEEKEDDEEEEEPSYARSRKRPPLAIAQIGVDMGPRFYDYDNVQTQNLRRYRATFIFQPRLRVEVYPLSRILTGIPAGIGVEADYSFAVGLQSSPTGGPNYPTKLSRLDLGARLRMKPIADSDLVINPLLGYRIHTFATSPAEDGTRLEGLADITYSALRVGGTVEQPILNDDAAVIGELAVLPLLGTGPLDQYFPQSGGFGFELGVGFAYTIAPKLQLKVGATVTRYGLGFTVAETDTYRADGASDLFANGTLAVRYTF